MSEHILREIEKLKRKILSLSALVEERVQQAIQSVNEKNAPLAQKIIDGDIEVDQMEVDVEEECLKILALYQPVAIDLRFVVAVLKINGDLERVGDLAVNIAERALFLAKQDPSIAVPDFTEMIQKSLAMLRLALDSLMMRDIALARHVCMLDDEIDEMNRRIFGTVQAGIVSNPARIEPLLHFLSISRHLERIADYATNVAEEVIYMIKGEIIRHRVEVFIAQTESDGAQ